MRSSEANVELSDSDDSEGSPTPRASPEPGVQNNISIYDSSRNHLAAIDPTLGLMYDDNMQVYIPTADTKKFAAVVEPRREGSYSLASLTNPDTQPPSLEPLSLLDPMDVPPQNFPRLKSCQLSLPIRLLDQGPILTSLDKIFYRQKYTVDGRHLANPMDKDEGKGARVRSKLEISRYEEHIKARSPYVGLASTRLQAVMEVRNDTEFELPQSLPSTPISASLRAASGPNVLTPSMKRVFSTDFLSGPLKRARSDGDLAARYNCDGTLSGSQKTLEAVGRTVDKETGRGLREYLLQMGKEFGMRKRSCDSITFLDFTPDMKSNIPEVDMLQHLTESKGYRIDVYEVDL
jgi:hypothetical protein